MNAVLDELRGLEKLAVADAAGDAKAHGELLKGIRTLQLAVETPLETTSRLNFQPLHNICIRIAIEYRWLHTIASLDGNPITAAEVAARTGTNELLVVRVMRVLTVIGICEETSYQTYAANARTYFKIQQGSIGAEKHHFDLDFVNGGRLVGYMRGPGIHQFADNVGEVTLFEYAHGTKSIFELLEKSPEQKEAFDNYMRSRRLADAPQWFEIYPASMKLANAHDDTDAILLVDIGGGPGQEVELFKKRNPKIPGLCFLQDLPITLQRIDRLHEGIEVMAYDFFTPQPLIGARVYFLRNVLHNWSDVRSAEILSRVAEAMDPEYSVLLIDDYVLPDTNVKLRGAEMDILMWLHTSGIERTESHWRSLCSSVGLEVVKFWSADRGEESVIEIKKMRVT